jgi:hypothetical protein
VKPFDEVITAVKSVDDAIHAFNDAGKEEEKTIELGKGSIHYALKSISGLCTIPFNSSLSVETRLWPLRISRRTLGVQ